MQSITVRVTLLHLQLSHSVVKFSFCSDVFIVPLVSADTIIMPTPALGRYHHCVDSIIREIPLFSRYHHCANTIIVSIPSLCWYHYCVDTIIVPIPSFSRCCHTGVLILSSFLFPGLQYKMTSRPGISGKPVIFYLMVEHFRTGFRA